MLTAAIYFFGKTVPPKNTTVNPAVQDKEPGVIRFDSILVLAKKQLNAEQLSRLSNLENSLPAGTGGKSTDPEINIDQQLKIYHQLAHFWSDTAGIFEPYAWYEAEAARLENSEKSLTFAARLFLDNLQADGDLGRRRWKAVQAKDLFERSLKINPANDSARVGLGATYLFGNISSNPMEGILKIREVVDKDSTNLYAQLTLAKGSVISGQYDKAIARLETVVRIQPRNLEANLLLADVYERMANKSEAIRWYQKSLPLIGQAAIRAEVENRINELRK